MLGGPQAIPIVFPAPQRATWPIEALDYDFSIVFPERLPTLEVLVYALPVDGYQVHVLHLLLHLLPYPASNNHCAIYIAFEVLSFKCPFG